MLNVRPHARAKLNVLITQDRPHAPEHWTSQFPRLLEPQGVVAYVARSGREAMDLTAQYEIHAAVVDWGTPLGENGTGRAGAVNQPSVPSGSANANAGTWLLELFRRLPNRPPVVLVRGPAYSQRQLDRLMHEALKLGAFSVVNKPVDLEQMLTVFRRLIDRRYRGTWPSPQ